MSITLSEKHGLNPSIEVCFICGEDTGSLLLFGRQVGDEEAPRRCVSGNLCDKCKEAIKDGYVALIEAIMTSNGPKRLGRYVFIKRECINQEAIGDNNIAYCDTRTMDKIEKALTEKDQLK